MAAQCDINERERQPLRGCHKSEKKKKTIPITTGKSDSDEQCLPD
jgi:hypothetical protein